MWNAENGSYPLWTKVIVDETNPNQLMQYFCLKHARGEPRDATRPGGGRPSRIPRRAPAYSEVCHTKRLWSTTSPNAENSAHEITKLAMWKFLLKIRNLNIKNMKRGVYDFILKQLCDFVRCMGGMQWVRDGCYRLGIVERNHNKAEKRSSYTRDSRESHNFTPKMHIMQMRPKPMPPVRIYWDLHTWLSLY